MAMKECVESPTLDVILVGCGNMGFALLTNWLQPGNGVAVHVVEPSADFRARAVALGASASLSANEIPSSLQPSVVVFAVKPNDIAALIGQYRSFLSAGAVLVSVAAGVGVSALEHAAGGQAPIIRCVPNIPISVGAGTSVCYANSNVSDHQRLEVERLLGKAGATIFVADEADLDAATAVSGSGPAYLFYFIECLTKAAVAAGLSAELGRQIATQTCYGASFLALRSELDASALRKQVTSPNGTTQAAMDVFQENGAFERIIGRAVEQARARSVELGIW
jgi:pyrroline-5-carboxylate reductase